MKKILLALMLSIAGSTVVCAQSAEAKPAAGKAQISLADARGKIDKAIESPAVLKETMKKLSAEDQRLFLADVNKAIGDLPASVEEKTAKYLNANHAAVTAAHEGNVTTLLAEVFATVPPEALTVINERFATDLLNRAANPNVTYTDEQYLNICTNLMAKINERTEETDNGSARSAFAILMLLRASNGTPEYLNELSDRLVDTLKHDDAKELAKDEWIPSALGKDGREAGYEPLLASANAGRRPDFAFTLVIAGPQYLESILEDVVGKNTDRMSFMPTRTPVLDAVENPLVHQVPTLHDEVFGGGAGGPPPTPSNPLAPENPEEPQPQPVPPHPVPYKGQSK